jgi:hypothetical protein
MRCIIPAIFAFGVVAGSSRGWAACGDEPSDAAAVAAVRAQIELACPCAEAADHASYLRCARSVVGAANMSTRCRKVVLRCARGTTCGRPGAVACCRVRADRTRCSILRNAGRCTAAGGCVSAAPSCCDACDAAGCATTTTTTTLPNLAGTWMLTGVPQPDGACPVSAPFWESLVAIAQTGDTLSAQGMRGYQGTVTATSFTLFDTGLPYYLSCPGGFYDGFVHIAGTIDSSGTPTSVTQGWGLLPPSPLPGCPTCQLEWLGTMSRVP